MSFQNPLPAGIRQVVPDYVSDGVTLTWGFPFRLWAAADLYVGVSSNAGATWTQLVLGTNYTITINGASSAIVTLTAVQASGNLIRLQGLRTPSRTTSVVNDGVVQSAPIESEFDVVEATMQEQRRDITAEVVRALASDAAIWNVLTPVSALVQSSIANLVGGVAPSLPTVEPSTPGTYWNNGGLVCVTAGGLVLLPTSLPSTPGQFWNNGGALCIS